MKDILVRKEDAPPRSANAYNNGIRIFNLKTDLVLLLEQCVISLY